MSVPCYGIILKSTRDLVINIIISSLNTAPARTIPPTTIQDGGRAWATEEWNIVHRINKCPSVALAVSDWLTDWLNTAQKDDCTRMWNDFPVVEEEEKEKDWNHFELCKSRISRINILKRSSQSKVQCNRKGTKKKLFIVPHQINRGHFSKVLTLKWLLAISLHITSSFPSIDWARAF